MNKFSADASCKIGCMLGTLIQALDFCDIPARSFVRLTPDKIYDSIQNIEALAGENALLQSAKCAMRILEDLKNRQVPMSEMKFKLDGLQKLLHSELEEDLFLSVPHDRAEDYLQTTPLFGVRVWNSFRSARYDIEEAGKCVALGRFTASVLHAMRIQEIGLKSLCSMLHVPYGGEKSQDVLSKLASKCKQQSLNQRSTPSDREFYRVLYLNLGHLKSAWHKHTTRPCAQYAEKDAEAILVHTKTLMQHLAIRLEE